MYYLNVLSKRLLQFIKYEPSATQPYLMNKLTKTYFSNEHILYILKSTCLMCVYIPKF